MNGNNTITIITACSISLLFLGHVLSWAEHFRCLIWVAAPTNTTPVLQKRYMRSRGLHVSARLRAQACRVHRDCSWGWIPVNSLDPSAGRRPHPSTQHVDAPSTSTFHTSLMWAGPAPSSVWEIPSQPASPSSEATSSMTPSCTNSGKMNSSPENHLALWPSLHQSTYFPLWD